MKEADRFHVHRTGLLILLGWSAVGLSQMGWALEGAPDGQAETFALQEVSVFDQSAQSFLRGQSASCSANPLPGVKALPEFKSAKPLYGMVSFPGTGDKPQDRRTCRFAFDESQGTGRGYDRMYFDLNGDADLRNDPVLKPRAGLPDSARLKYSNIQQQVLFDFVSLDFSFGPKGTRPVELMPRLYISKYGDETYPQVSFVRTRVYQGDIRVGGKPFHATLGNDRIILGRLDQPGTALLLRTDKSQEGVAWWGGDRLSGVQKIDGQFYTFDASPLGDKLTTRHYAGPVGTFEIGPGNRKLDRMTVEGSLKDSDRAVPVGGKIEGGTVEPAQRCQIPEGNYTPDFITVQYGRLNIEMSENYHSDGKRQNRSDRPYVYGIAIGPEKPFVLNFTNPPEVMFASPAPQQRIKAGDTLTVYGVLIDPKLDIMIRGLDDTSRKQTKGPDGRPLGYERNFSLDPHVTITRSNGDKVAEGVMPFG